MHAEGVLGGGGQWWAGWLVGILCVCASEVSLVCVMGGAKAVIGNRYKVVRL